jgi:hypothetical protein
MENIDLFLKDLKAHDWSSNDDSRKELEQVIASHNKKVVFGNAFNSIRSLKGVFR